MRQMTLERYEEELAQIAEQALRALSPERRSRLIASLPDTFPVDTAEIIEDIRRMASAGEPLIDVKTLEEHERKRDQGYVFPARC